MYVIVASCCVCVNRSAVQCTVDVETTSNDEHDITQRLFTSTTTKSSDGPAVQVPCTATPNVRGHRSVADGSDKLPIDGLQLKASSDGPPWSFVDAAAPTATCRDDDATSLNSHRQLADDVARGTEAETEAYRSSAHARCTAVTRFASGECDDVGGRSALPPDVAADTDVLATAAADASASDRCPYAAVARAASRAASGAVCHVIWQVRDLRTNGSTERDVVELELSARCIVRCHRSVSKVYVGIGCSVV